MQITIVYYAASTRPDVQGFFDVEVDGLLRFNGIHLLRDGTLRAMQLTPLIAGRRMFRSAVEVLDADLRARLESEILAAIREHIETLPEEQRSKPPLTAEERARFKAKPVPEKTKPQPRPVVPTPVPEKPKAVRPPLLAGWTPRPAKTTTAKQADSPAPTP